MHVVDHVHAARVVSRVNGLGQQECSFRRWGQESWASMILLSK
jgi:hypothetical protein